MSGAQLLNHSRVVIVGAGPVGLTAALVLARAGVEVSVLEAADKLVEDLRTTIIHPSSIEVWNLLGAAEGIVGYGSRCRTMQFRERENGLVANMDYACLEDVTAFPHITLCALPFVVPDLYSTLLTTGRASVHFGHRVEQVAHRENGVLLRLQGPDGPRDIGADFVIAADGTRSIIRDAFAIHRLRIAPGNKLYRVTVGDNVEQLIPDVERFSYVMDPQCYGLILKNPGFWRIPVGLGAEVTEDEQLDSETTGAQLIKNFIFPGMDVQITAARPLVVTNWIASEFGVGNILLAGDSAHAMNPMAGLGMNSGVLDAVDAALGVLDAVKLGRVGPRWAKYLSQRPRVARDIAVRALNRYTLLTEADPARQARRNAWLKEAESNDRLRRARLEEFSLLDHFHTLRPELEAAVDGSRAGTARQLMAT